MYYDHLLHFYYLAAPDFVVGPDAPAAERNILGVIGKVGLEVGKTVIDRRAKAIDVMKYFGGKRTHPIISLPGGVSRQLEEEYRQTMVEQATEAVEFTKFTLQVFEDVVLKNKAYLDLVLSEAYGGQETYYIGLVTDDNKVDFYDGYTRIVDPEGKEFAKYEPKDYLNYLEEHVEPWTYLKTTYLKDVGWKGFVTGKDSGIYRGGPLGRLNAADGMQTPLAQAEYEKFYDTLGGKPVHATLAYHWARLVEMMQGAELWLEFAKDESTTAPDVRNIPEPLTGPSDGVGTIEAARGHLIHHYWTDENGITTDVNLIVATTHNYAGINIACRNAAKALIKDGQVNDGLLNMVEMAFRAYDPCFACATHSLPGQMPLEAVIYEADGSEYKRLKK